MGQLVKITLVYVVFNIKQLNNFSPSQSFQEIAVVINIKGRGEHTDKHADIKEHADIGSH